MFEKEKTKVFKGEKRKYPACRPTLSACKKYKKPTGKTSSKTYNWKKK